MLAPLRRLQAGARGLLVRRCLLPCCVLERELASRCARALLPPGRSVPDLYLRPTATRTSFVYCDRRTRFWVADALSLGIRRVTPRDTGAARVGRAPNAKKAGKRKAAAALAARPWRGVPARACVDEAYGELFRRNGPGRRLWDRATPTWHPDIDDLFDPHAAEFDFDDPLAGLWRSDDSLT